MSTLIVDDLHFEVRRSPRRRSVQITVDRGGELILTAPKDCPLPKMEAFVREKRYWVYTKLAEKESYRPPPPPKQYVSGEGFPYLGRSYRLLLVDGQDVPVKLERGRFKMRREVAEEGRAHMIRWYTEHARPWLERRVGEFAPRLGVRPGRILVRDLGFRWGSCAKNGALNFHWQVATLPPRLVEYVVVHELVHIVCADHTRRFWARLGRAMADYEERKEALSALGTRVTL